MISVNYHCTIISLSERFFVVIESYYESSDRATLLGCPICFLSFNATALLFIFYAVSHCLFGIFVKRSFSLPRGASSFEV